MRKTTIAIPTPLTRALNERDRHPDGASRRALTAAMRSPSTTWSGATSVGDTTWLAGGGFGLLVPVGGVSGGVVGSQASPMPSVSASAWLAFALLGQLSHAST